ALWPLPATLPCSGRCNAHRKTRRFRLCSEAPRSVSPCRGSIAALNLAYCPARVDVGAPSTPFPWNQLLRCEMICAFPPPAVAKPVVLPVMNAFDKRAVASIPPNTLASTPFAPLFDDVVESRFNCAAALPADTTTKPEFCEDVAAELRTI